MRDISSLPGGVPIISVKHPLQIAPPSRVVVKETLQMSAYYLAGDRLPKTVRLPTSGAKLRGSK